MKKFLCGFIAIMVVMMMCTVAFAAPEIGSETGEGNKITVKVTGLQDGDECTLLVVDAGIKLADVASDVTKIYYIDQVTSVSGVATFDLTVEAGKNVDIYSGYTSMGDESPLELLAKVEEDVVYGDVDGNGIVEGKDRTILARYLANWDGYTIIEKAADVDCNGVIEGKDRTILARHLANWNGYETLPVK